MTDASVSRDIFELREHGMAVRAYLVARRAKAEANSADDE